MKTLLKGGKIIDGSGERAFVGDILFDENGIIDIGQNLVCGDAVVKDCEGLTVSPGFIDAHSHNDFFYDYPNSQMFYEPFIRQGITTQITGNCGFSPFGIAKNSIHTDEVGGGLFHSKNSGSFCDFIKASEGNLLVNIVPLIGHGTTRISINGYDANPLTASQIEEELELVREAMDNGAFGGSFGFMYEPGMYAKKDELFAFASEIAKYDGILTVHPRACSKVALGYPLLSKPHIEIALDEVIEIMENAKVRTEYSHLIFVGKSSWGSCDKMLKKFHDLNDAGYKIAYDNYSYTYGASVITIVLPPWYMALPKAERKKPFNMFKLKLMTNITKKILGLNFCDFTIAFISNEHKQYEGKTVSECAKEEGLSDFDMYIKLVDLSNGQGRLYLDQYYNEEIIRKLMEDDLSIFMTDAWVEESGTQNGAAYQAFAYFLKRANDYKLPLEKVLRKMTGATADRFFIKDRGYLKKGFASDIVVFDENGIKVEPKIPNFTPLGFKFVYINGELVLNGDKYSAKRVGKTILKK